MESERDQDTGRSELSVPAGASKTMKRGLLVDAELTLAEPGFGQPPSPMGIRAAGTPATGLAARVVQVTTRLVAHGASGAPGQHQGQQQSQEAQDCKTHGCDKPDQAGRGQAPQPLLSEPAQARAAEMALIARCQAGDREAFGVLLDRYRERIVNLAFQLLRQRDAAEDVAQEAFTKAFSSIGSFRGDAQMYTWLYRITINLCLQRQRRAKHVEPLEDEHGQERADSQVQVEEQVVTRMLVEQTLDRLSEPLRVVLILREMHELSYEEVATVLRIPVGTVRSRLNEARRKFRELWLQAEAM